MDKKITANFFKIEIIKFLIVNAITFSRIVISVFLLNFPFGCKIYYILFTCAGITDIVDGFLSRKLMINTNIGSKFDTFADFLFLVCSFFSIIKVFQLSCIFWALLLIIIIFKIYNIYLGLKTNNKIILPHTTLNKILGIVLFVTVYFIENIMLNNLNIIFYGIFCFALCVVINENIFINFNS